MSLIISEQKLEGKKEESGLLCKENKKNSFKVFNSWCYWERLLAIDLMRFFKENLL